jgi:hypothetical protein
MSAEPHIWRSSIARERRHFLSQHLLRLVAFATSPKNLSQPINGVCRKNTLGSRGLPRQGNGPAQDGLGFTQSPPFDQQRGQSDMPLGVMGRCASVLGYRKSPSVEFLCFIHVSIPALQVPQLFQQGWQSLRL